MKRPMTNHRVADAQADIAQLTIDYCGRGHDLDAKYFARLNELRNIAKREAQKYDK